MVNSSRWLGADDGLRMQQEAAAQVAQASQKAVDTASAGVQRYLSSAVENSQRLMELEVTRQQVEIKNASQPNQFSELIKAGVGIAADIREQEKKAELQKQQQQQAIASTQRYTQAEDQLNNLIGSYEADNWSKGEEQMKADASKLLAQYAPTTPEEAKEFQRLLQKVNDSYRTRTQTRGRKLEEASEQTINFQTAKVRSQLEADLRPQITWLKKGDFGDQGGQRVVGIRNYLDNFLQVDNGLPTAKKYQIVSEFLKEVDDAYGSKLERYTEYQSNLRDFRAYTDANVKINYEQQIGKISFQQAEAARGELDQRYPGFSKYHFRPGQQEQLQLTLAQQQQQYNDIVQKQGQAVANQVFLDNEAVKSIAAGAFLDPIFRGNLENGTYKDQPSVRTALQLANLLQTYETNQAQLNLRKAQNATAIARQNLTSVEAYVNTAQRLAYKQQSGEQLTPEEQQQSEIFSRLDPALRALIFGADGKRRELDPAALKQANDFFAAEVQKVNRQLLLEQQAANQAFTAEFQSVINLGLVTPDGRLDKDKLNQLRQQAQPNLTKLNERVNQAQLEAQQQFQPRYGIQPNFDQSSSQFAPVTDDNGQLRLVPRAQAQVINVGGQKIVTPVIAGVNAPISAGGQFGAPRKYRNGTHYGLDFAQGTGGKSIALMSGTVVHVGTAGGYGGFVDILGDNGVLYRYGHQRSLVRTGQRVFPGQAVSESDGSGVGDPHLHFEVRPNPKFNNGRYDVNKNFGGSGAVDPVEHLKKLSLGQSNVLQPRGDYRAFRSQPTQKAPGNSLLTSGGGAVYGGNYQRVGSASVGNVQNRFTGQRPVRTGAMKGQVKVGQHEWDINDDMGYAELRKDTRLLRAFHQTAQNLGVPTEWIVDIARQESGGINPNKDHNGNHYGLFGFGKDSFSDKTIHQNLRAGKIDGVGQLALYERYLRENGWDKVVKQKQGNLTIADLWAFTRMGWNDRHKFWNTGDLSIQASKSIPKTYAQELELLGKWAGRRYEIPGGQSRRDRNKAVDNKLHSSCQLCQSLQASGSPIVPHQHVV